MTDVITITEGLAEDFRKRAAEVDREGRFPHENYEKMRRVGYLAALVPEELGGLGATLGEMSRAQQALARGCASTALAVNMHHFQVGAAADAYRAGAATEATLRRVVSEGIVLGSTGAEFIVAGDWTTSTTAERDGDHYVLNGRKFFCSQADGMDVVRVNACEAGSGDLLILPVPADGPGVTVVPTWDTTGMRGTASHDLVLENVRVPAAAATRLNGPAPMRDPKATNLVRWFLVLVSGVYIGVAEEARAEALRAIGGGRNSAFRAEPLTDVLLGEMEAAFLTATSVRDAVAERLATPQPDADTVVAQAALCKEVVTSAVQTVMARALAITGGRAFFRRSALERLNRDMLAARFHPPSAPVSFQIAGAGTRRAAAKAAAADAAFSPAAHLFATEASAAG